MWEIKIFASRGAMEKWISKNKNRIQYEEIFVNKAFAKGYEKGINDAKEKILEIVNSEK